MFEKDDLPSKSERTRAKISEAAISSFIEHGYADTTMRKIADAAGVSTGNAYYYFPSKDHLVQELYSRVLHEHVDAARLRLRSESNLIDRLRAVFDSGFATLLPYARIAPGFLTAMIAPDSPINPLSSESAEAREVLVGLFREAIDGSAHRLPADVATALPAALFVAYLALVLRWTYDTSPERRQTARMLDAGMRLLAVALPFTRVPGLRNAARELLTMIGEVRS